jgi:hypothetical protein
MNSSQSKDPQASASAKSAPIVLDIETLKQVAGGSVVINDPGWVVAPGGKPHGVVMVPDPGW